MKNLFKAFAPLLIASSVYDGVYIGNIPAKLIEPVQTKASIEAYKKAAEEKRRRKAEKLKRIFSREIDNVE